MIDFLLILPAVIALLYAAHLARRLKRSDADLSQLRKEAGLRFQRLEDRLLAQQRQIDQQQVGINLDEPAAAPGPEARAEHIRPAPSQPSPIPAAAAQETPPTHRGQFSNFTPAIERTEIPLQNPASEPQPAPRKLSLEERLGANWLNKLGIVILVIGLSFFLAVRLKTMGPAGKVLTGAAISLALLGGGLWLERKPTYRVFARAGIGGGWALLFFTAFAMHHLDATRVIESAVAGLLLMLLVATGMVLHSLRYRSQTITGLAFLLAFLTVAASHLESAHHTVLFSLLASAVLAAGLIVVTTRRHWAWLELAGLAAVLLNHFLWLSLILPSTTIHSPGLAPTFALAWPSTALILFYWVIFRAAYLLRKPLDAAEDRISSLSAVILAGGIIGLFKSQSTHPEWAFWALLAMGLVELALGLWARPRRRSAFIVLSTIGALLLIAAVPFRFHGVSWPILWIAEAHVLALCGLRLNEPIFRRLGLLAGIAASVVLGFHDLLPLAIRRASSDLPLPISWSLGFGLALAAILFWIHGEIYPRRFPSLFLADSVLDRLESAALRTISWLGVAAAAASLWVLVPDAWLAAAWLLLVVALGLLADRFALIRIALQSDALAAASIPAFVLTEIFDHRPGNNLPAALAIALLYTAMRRRTIPANASNYPGPAYSWAATLLLLPWLGIAANVHWLSLCWSGAAAALLTSGILFRKPYLRWQGMLALAFSFVRLEVTCVGQLNRIPSSHGWFGVGWLNTVSVLGFIALAYGVEEIIHHPNSAASSNPPNSSNSSSPSAPETTSTRILGALATLSIAQWLILIAPSWGSQSAAPILWALLATALAATAVFTHRRQLEWHAIAITLSIPLYAVTTWADHLSSSQPPWWQTHLARVVIACTILLAGLPFAFRLRTLSPRTPSTSFFELLRRPEQWFYFVPYITLVITLAIDLHSGSITLAWSLLGLAGFLFALVVGERTFRLGGLILLLFSVVKILLVDLWTLTPAERYTTLIVMGCALLLVSFLYTRFKDQLRRIL